MNEGQLKAVCGIIGSLFMAAVSVFNAKDYFSDYKRSKIEKK